MKRILLITITLIRSTVLLGQETAPKKFERHLLSLGTGIGVNYGYPGVSLGINPSKNGELDMFLSVGGRPRNYTVFSAGVRYRLMPNKRITPLITASIGCIGANGRGPGSTSMYSPAGGTGFELLFAKLIYFRTELQFVSLPDGFRGAPLALRLGLSAGLFKKTKTKPQATK